MEHLGTPEHKAFIHAIRGIDPQAVSEPNRTPQLVPAKVYADWLSDQNDPAEWVLRNWLDEEEDRRPKSYKVWGIHSTPNDSIYQTLGPDDEYGNTSRLIAFHLGRNSDDMTVRPRVEIIDYAGTSHPKGAIPFSFASTVEPEVVARFLPHLAVNDPDAAARVRKWLEKRFGYRDDDYPADYGDALRGG